MHDVFEGIDHVASTASPVAGQAQPRRKQGAPKGRPRPEGSGRKPGTRNGAQRDIADLMRPLIPHCRRRLRQLLLDPKSNADIVLRVVREVHDRVYGKSVDRIITAGTVDVRAAVAHVQQSALLQGIAHSVRQAHLAGEALDPRLLEYLPELAKEGAP